MFTDERRSKICGDIRQRGIQAFAARVTPAVLAEAAKRTGVAILNNPLNLASLVWPGISAAMNQTRDFAGILSETLKVLQDQPEFAGSPFGREKANAGKRKAPASRHSPKTRDRTQVSEEAFCQARRRMPAAFWVNLLIILVELFLKEHHELVTFNGFRVLAIDGTENDLQNWKALQDHFGRAKNKSGQHQPQARMVMLQFPGVRLPFRYELTPLAEGENTVARRLAAHLSANDLVLMDAGFWSYGLFCDIAGQGAFFAIRLKGNIGLKPVRRLNPHEELVDWTPNDSRSQWKKEGLPPTMRLRVIACEVPGFRPQKIVTNVLDQAAVSREDWTRLTTECDAEGRLLPGLFHRRWEIETTFRELKVDQGMETGLRSRTPESIQYEVAGHVVYYLLVRWVMVEAAIKHGVEPLRISFTGALQELREIRTSLIIASPTWARVLVGRLLQRIALHQVPFRPGRNFIRRKKSTNHKRKSNSAKNQESKKTRAAKKTNGENE